MCTLATLHKRKHKYTHVVITGNFVPGNLVTEFFSALSVYNKKMLKFVTETFEKNYYVYLWLIV